MAQMFLGAAVACIIFSYWLSEQVLAAFAMLFFFLAGGFFIDAAATNAFSDLFFLSGWALILGGGVASGMSMYLSKSRQRELDEEGLDELDDEVSVGEMEERRKGRNRNIRQNKKMKIADKLMRKGQE